MKTVFQKASSSASSLKSRPLRSVKNLTASAGITLMSAHAGIVYVADYNLTLSSSNTKTIPPATTESVVIDGTPVFTAILGSRQSNVPEISMINWDNGFNPLGFPIDGDKNPGTAFVFREEDEIPPATAHELSPSVLTNLFTHYNALSEGETAYIGFQFNPTGNQVLNGWIEFRLDQKVINSSSYTLTRYAYEDTGAPILAGQVGTLGPQGPQIIVTEYYEPTEGQSAFRVTVTSRQGATYQLQYSPNLETEFENVGDPVPAVGPALILEDSNAPEDRGFYRVLETR